MAKLCQQFGNTINYTTVTCISALMENKIVVFIGIELSSLLIILVKLRTKRGYTCYILLKQPMIHLHTKMYLAH